MERSKKIMFVSHCLLNQNVRAVGKSHYPGPVTEVLNMISEAGIGMVQLPCPKIEFEGGLNRKDGVKKYTASYKNACEKLSLSVLKQIEEYMGKKYNVVGILGVELSESCGVHQVKNGSRSVPGKGILIESLEEHMRKKNYQIPIVGVDLNNVFSSVEKINNLLKYY